MERANVEAVVLRVSEHGEGHRWVDLLTRERGVIRAFAPGAQRSRRRFGGTLEPGTHLSAAITVRPGRDVATLAEASILAAWPRIRERLDTIARAAYLVDLTRALVRDAAPHPELFDLLLAGLDRLDRGAFPPWGLPAFELAALDAVGVAPRLDACAGCGRLPSGERSRFAPAGGGLVCPVCEPHWRAGDLTVSRGTLKALQALAGAGPDPEVMLRADRLPEDPESVAEAREVTGRFIRHLVGRRLSSLDFLETSG